LLTAENQKPQARHERGENNELNEARVFEATEQLVAGPAAALLF